MHKYRAGFRGVEALGHQRSGGALTPNYFPNKMNIFFSK